MNGAEEFQNPIDDKCDVYIENFTMNLFRVQSAQKMF